MIRPALLAVALVVALAEGAVAADLRVVRVCDGDTFTGLDAENRQIKVRFHGIDAPEAKQAFGTVARKALADLIAACRVKRRAGLYRLMVEELSAAQRKGVAAAVVICRQNPTASLC